MIDEKQLLIDVVKVFIKAYLFEPAFEARLAIEGSLRKMAMGYPFNVRDIKVQFNETTNGLDVAIKMEDGVTILVEMEHS
jgi:hypothetical protein